jgi:hypothetical protein
LIFTTLPVIVVPASPCTSTFGALTVLMPRAWLVTVWAFSVMLEGVITIELEPTFSVMLCLASIVTVPLSTFTL